MLGFSPNNRCLQGFFRSKRSGSFYSDIEAGCKLTFSCYSGLRWDTFFITRAVALQCADVQTEAADSEKLERLKSLRRLESWNG